jgi:hypothetical protein
MTDEHTCIVCGHEMPMADQLFIPEFEGVPYICETCGLMALSVVHSLVKNQKPLDADISEAMSKIDWKEIML